MKNHLFVSFDGDNIGSKVGQAVLMDDVEGLHSVSEKIDHAQEAISDWVESNDGVMISKGGDQGVFVIDESMEHELESIRHAYLDITGSTLTVGTGHTLSQSGKALIAGKLMGKDILVKYDQQVEHVLADAHEHVASGTATKDEEKQDEAYISPTQSFHHEDGQEDQYEDGQEEMEEDADLDSMDDSQENVDEYDMSPDVSAHEESMEEPDEYSQELIEDASQDDQDLEDMHSEDRQQKPFRLHRSDREDEQHLDMDDEDQEGYRSDTHHDESEEHDSDTHQEEDDQESIKIPENENFKEDEDNPEKLIAQAADPEGESDDENSNNPEMHLENDDPEQYADQDEDHLDMPTQEEAPEEAQGPMEEEPKELDILSELLAEAGSTDELKAKVAAVLEKFKLNKDVIASMKEQNPEAYDSIILMLKQMIEMARNLAPESPEEDAPPAGEQELPKM